MNERETAKAIEHQASAWVARLDREPVSSELEAELNTWLAGDTRRQGAFLRAEAAWAMLDRTGAPMLAAPAPSVALTRRRLFSYGAAAASVAVAAVGVSVWAVMRFASGEHIRTVRGEVRRVPLDDGSMLAVNTESQLRIAVDGVVRKVDLERGEAWFQVAKDSSRPFVVNAGGVNVRAVGTAFSVRRREHGADVLVTEGVVEIWSSRAPGRVRRLSVGDHAYVSDAMGPGASQTATAEIDRRLAWRDGEIVLDGDTLEEAVAEFNRYNQRQIVIEDPVLSSEVFVGRFRTNEPEAFARAVSVTTNARLIIDDEAIRISRL